MPNLEERRSVSQVLVNAVQEDVNGIPVFHWNGEGEAIISLSDNMVGGELYIGDSRIGDLLIMPVKGAEANIYSDGERLFEKNGRDLVIKNDLRGESSNKITLRNYFTYADSRSDRVTLGFSIDKKINPGVTAQPYTISTANTDIAGILPYGAPLLDARGRFSTLQLNNNKLFYLIFNENGLLVKKSEIIGDPELGTNGEVVSQKIAVDRNFVTASSNSVHEVELEVRYNQGNTVYPISVMQKVLKDGNVVSSQAQAKLLVVEPDGRYFVKDVQTINGGANSEVKFSVGDFYQNPSSKESTFCSFRDQQGGVSYVQCEDLNQDTQIEINSAKPEGFDVVTQDNSVVEIVDASQEGSFVARIAFGADSISITPTALMEAGPDGLAMTITSEGGFFENAGQPRNNVVALGDNSLLTITPRNDSMTVVYNFGGSSKLNLVGFDERARENDNMFGFTTKYLSTKEALNYAARQRRDGFDLDASFDLTLISLPDGQDVLLYGVSPEVVASRIDYVLPTPSPTRSAPTSVMNQAASSVSSALQSMVSDVSYSSEAILNTLGTLSTTASKFVSATVLPSIMGSPFPAATATSSPIPNPSDDHNQDHQDYTIAIISGAVAFSALVCAGILYVAHKKNVNNRVAPDADLIALEDVVINNDEAALDVGNDGNGELPPAEVHPFDYDDLVYDVNETAL